MRDFLSCLFFALLLHALNEQQNTMRLPALGITDPHLRHDGEIFWLFVGNDVDPSSSDWVMPFWSVYESSDLMDWQLRTHITPKDNFMPDTSNKCWAPDAAFRNGKTYFYFSNHNKSTGVMQANRPAGVYEDVLGKPLLPKNLTSGMEFDPTVFIDDDSKKTPYIVFGYKGRGGYFIARLKESMTAIDEIPKALTV